MPEDSNSWYIGPASSQKREGHLIVRKVPVNPPPYGRNRVKKQKSSITWLKLTITIHPIRT